MGLSTDTWINITFPKETKQNKSALYNLPKSLTFEAVRVLVFTKVPSYFQQCAEIYHGVCLHQSK